MAVPDAARVGLEVGVDDGYGIWRPTTVGAGINPLLVVPPPDW